MTDSPDPYPVDVRGMGFSCLGRGSAVTGSFLLRGAAHLHAKCEGDVVMEDNRPLVLEDEGVLTGTIKGHDVDIFGQFTGTIHSTGRVAIHGTAVVAGDVESASLVVHAGAHVNVKARTRDDGRRAESKKRPL